ncbi:MAG TPA: hypothetical protein VMH33_11220 [Solirubrobacterales bacterium]|nr:hypothetical protein [Solirubrobacterales bacterium]
MEPLAVSTGIAVAYAVVLWIVLIIAPATITALKGQWLLLIAGWFTLGLVWWITALRLGRPRSWWARHIYGPDKLARAQARYGPSAPEPEGV